MAETKTRSIEFQIKIENLERVENLANEIREKTEEVNSLIKKLSELTLTPIICRK